MWDNLLDTRAKLNIHKIIHTTCRKCLITFNKSNLSTWSRPSKYVETSKI